MKSPVFFILFLFFFALVVADKKTKIEPQPVQIQEKQGVVLQAKLFYKGWIRWKAFAHQSVTFYLGEQELGKSTTDEKGTAQFFVTDVPIGKHSWTCTFAGTPKYSACETKSNSFEIKSSHPKVLTNNAIEQVFYLGQQHLFFIQPDQSLGHWSFDGNQWQELEPVPGVKAFSAVSVVPFEDQLFIFYSDFKKSLKVVRFQKDQTFTPAKNVYSATQAIRTNEAPAVCALDQMLMLSYLDENNQLKLLSQHFWNENGLVFQTEKILAETANAPIQQAIASGGEDWGILVTGAWQKEQFFTVHLPLTENGIFGELSPQKFHSFETLKPFQLHAGLDGVVSLCLQNTTKQIFSSSFKLGEWSEPLLYATLEEREPLFGSPRIAPYFSVGEQENSSAPQKNAVYALITAVTTSSDLVYTLKKTGEAEYEYLGKYDLPSQQLLGYIEGPPPVANENLQIRHNVKEEDSAITMYEEEWLQGIQKGLEISTGFLHSVGLAGTHAQMQAGLSYHKNWGEKVILRQTLKNELINYREDETLHARPVGMALLMRLQTDTYRITMKDENGNPLHNNANLFVMVPKKVMIVARPYHITQRGIPGKLGSYFLSPLAEKELQPRVALKLLNTWSIGGGLVQSQEFVSSKEHEMGGYFSFHFGLHTGVPFIAGTKHQIQGKLAFRYQTRTQYTRKLSTTIHMKGDGLTPGSYKSYDFYTYLLKPDVQSYQEFVDYLTQEDRQNPEFQNISPQSQPWTIRYAVTNLAQIPHGESATNSTLLTHTTRDDLDAPEHRRNEEENMARTVVTTAREEITPQAMDDSKEALRLAEYYLQLKKFRDSRPLLKKALTLNPYLEPALFENAKLAFQKEYYQATIEYCNILLSFGMRIEETNILLEQAKYHLRRLQGSELLQLAKRSLNQGHVTEGQSHLEAALSFDDSLEEEALKMAHSYYSVEKYRECLECCQIIQKHNPKNEKAKELFNATQQKILESQILRDTIKRGIKGQD